MLTLNISWEENLIKAHAKPMCKWPVQSAEQKALRRNVGARIKEIKKLISKGLAVVV